MVSCLMIRFGIDDGQVVLLWSLHVDLQIIYINFEVIVFIVLEKY